MSACGFINAARTLSSSAGPCSHMLRQWHGYFSCSELQNPQSSTDQRPLLSAGHNDNVDIDRLGGFYHSLNILLYCPACDWLNLENGTQVDMKECHILLSLYFFSFFVTFPWELRLTMYIQRILAEEWVAILKHPYSPKTFKTNLNNLNM